jgi:hypothetical protein
MIFRVKVPCVGRDFSFFAAIGASDSPKAPSEADFSPERARGLALSCFLAPALHPTTNTKANGNHRMVHLAFALR